MEILKTIISFDWQALFASVGVFVIAVVAVMSSLVEIFKAIPGDQPEKFIEEKILPALNKVAEKIKEKSKK